MVLFRNFSNIFKIPELMRKIVFTLGVLIVYRIGAFIPVSGINVERLNEILRSQESLIAGVLGYFNTFSGGALQKCALFALGINPYIVASIVMQFATMAFPFLERLSKEGEYGRKQINQYTRYLTLALSVFQGSGYLAMLETSGLVLAPTFGFRCFFILALTTGSMFVMWLGEQISQFGIGNGSSILIFAGIVSALPSDVIQTIVSVQNGYLSLLGALGIAAFFAIIAACIVFLEKGERKIPVQYARRVIGQRVYGGQSSYIPFKINNVGVMPAIFSQTIMGIPQFIIGLLSSYFALSSLKDMAQSFMMNGLIYNTLLFILIIVFTYVYTSVIFDPQELSQNLRKNGGFIPGIRPGKETAEYLDSILTKISLAGALYLGVLAISPNVLRALVDHMPFALGGTSLLIVVGVALELSSQIEAYLLEHNYAGFLPSKNRIKSKVNNYK